MFDKRFYVPVMTVLALAAVVLLVQAIADMPSDWRSYVCKEDECTLQEWMSATSGWVGFAAAAIGAYFVYHQLAEQRRQTAFMLGDGAPTMELVRASGKVSSGIIRVLNWNRRTLVIQSITLVCPHTLPKPTRFLFSSDGVDCEGPIGEAGWIADRPRVDGWINRQAAPSFIDFYLQFEAAIEPSLVKKGTTIPLSVKVHCFHPADSHHIKTMDLDVPLRGIFPKPDATFD